MPTLPGAFLVSNIDKTKVFPHRYAALFLNYNKNTGMNPAILF